MPHHEDHFQGSGGVDFFEQWWLPDGESTAVVVIVHGFTEHSSRYNTLAEELNRHGYAVYTMDHQGHGRSGGPRGHVDRFDDYLVELDELLERVHNREPGKPLFLFGHSMGGTILALYDMNRQLDVRGIVLSGVGAKVSQRVYPSLRKLAAFGSRWFPRVRLVKLGGNFVSRDPEVVQKFKDDPLIFHKRFTVRIGAEILDAADRVLAGAQSIHSPLLVLHGTGDMVCSHEGAEQLYDAAGSTDKTLKLYDGLYHEMLSEPEKEQVLADLLEWLDARR